jgi:hypothetical protein
VGDCDAAGAAAAGGGALGRFWGEEPLPLALRVAGETLEVDANQGALAEMELHPPLGYECRAYNE